jgi:hypothetical protein
MPTAAAVSANECVTPAPAIPTAASATPTGISQASESRSDTAPNSGWMIDEPTVTASSSAPAAPYE